MRRAIDAFRGIVTSSPAVGAGGRAGLRALSELECGHSVETLASQRRQRYVWCRECAASVPSEVDILPQAAAMRV